MLNTATSSFRRLRYFFLSYEAARFSQMQSNAQNNGFGVSLAILLLCTVYEGTFDQYIPQ